MDKKGFTHFCITYYDSNRGNGLGAPVVLYVDRHHLDEQIQAVRNVRARKARVYVYGMWPSGELSLVDQFLPRVRVP